MRKEFKSFLKKLPAAARDLLEFLGFNFVYSASLFFMMQVTTQQFRFDWGLFTFLYVITLICYIGGVLCNAFAYENPWKIGQTSIFAVELVAAIMIVTLQLDVRIWYLHYFLCVFFYIVGICALRFNKHFVIIFMLICVYCTFIKIEFTCGADYNQSILECAQGVFGVNADDALYRLIVMRIHEDAGLAKEMWPLWYIHFAMKPLFGLVLGSNYILRTYEMEAEELRKRKRGRRE